jgi:predicted secreted protein
MFDSTGHSRDGGVVPFERSGMLSQFDTLLIVLVEVERGAFATSCCLSLVAVLVVW